MGSQVLTDIVTFEENVGCDMDEAYNYIWQGLPGHQHQLTYQGSHLTQSLIGHKTFCLNLYSITYRI